MFEVLPHLAPDPILGLSAAFREDTNPNKIDLGVGVYKDEQGNTCLLYTSPSPRDSNLSRMPSSA